MPVSASNRCTILIAFDRVNSNSAGIALFVIRSNAIPASGIRTIAIAVVTIYEISIIAFLGLVTSSITATSIVNTFELIVFARNTDLIRSTTQTAALALYSLGVEA